MPKKRNECNYTQTKHGFHQELQKTGDVWKAFQYQTKKSTCTQLNNFHALWKRNGGVGTCYYKRDAVSFMELGT